MPLTSGTALGPYVIELAIGAGGMGVVYRATDTNLRRSVAIKVLPEAFATDADRLARFQREAELLARLNHPNIAQIYGLERASGTTALVMECVEGPTLADRIARGPIPVAEALAIARQIADGLEAAHSQGIIHRDLKPANVKVRSDGTVKVLDFGLAKATAGPGAAGDVSNALTVDSPRATVAGVIVGTVAYMSPEQATGKPVDERSDIWAFGCVLYEMLAGCRVFPGATMAETSAAILTRDIDWTKLPATTPDNVRVALRRTLEKNPKRRLHDIADVRIELEDTAATQTVGALEDSRQTTVRWLAAIIATSMTIGFAAWHFKPAARGVVSGSVAVTRLVVEPEAPLPAEGEGVMALSPDGRRLAYVVTTGGGQLLYLRELDQFEGRPIPGTDGADGPAFSSDGKWLAFAAQGQVRKVPVAGGTPVTLCEGGTGRGLSWESDDSILFARGTSGIWRVPSAGGRPSAVTTLAAGEFEHNFPEILPGGKALLYSAVAGVGGLGGVRVIAQSLETGTRREIAEGSGARYLATGHVVYVDRHNLFAVRFDVAKLETRGSPAVVLQGVRQTQYGTPQIAFSAAGSMTYVPAAGSDGHQDTLVWVDTAGVERPTALSGRDLSMPRLAPDLERVVVVTQAVNQSDLWLFDLVRGSKGRLTFDGTGSFPVWGPEGATIAYRSIAGSNNQAAIRVKAVDDTKPEELLSTNANVNVPLSWSPDGRYLAAVTVNPKTANDIWVRDLSAHTASAFVATEFQEGAPTFSNDGRWIAYASEKSGRKEIYMRPFPGPGEEVTVSTDGGTEPVWARKAGRLFYRRDDAMMLVDVTTGASAAVGKPRRIFERPYNRSNAFWPNYDVTPDGGKLLMIKRDSQEDSRRLFIVLNWLSELTARVP